MSTNYPTSLDTPPTSPNLAGHTLATDGHRQLHYDLGDAIRAIETTIGVTGGFHFEAALTFSTGLSRAVNTITVDQSFSPTWTGTHTFSLATTNFGAAAVPATLQQVAPSSGAGNSLTIAASAAVSGNTNGGNVVLKPGAKSGGGTDGFTDFLAPGGTIGSNDLQLAVSGTTVTNTVAPSAGSGQRFRVVCRDSSLDIQDGGVGFSFTIASGRKWIIDNNNFRAGSGVGIGWSSNTDPGGAANDTGLKRAAAKVVGVTDGATGSGTLSSVPVPVSLGTDQTDYNPGVFRTLRINATASFNLNSLVAGVDGEERFLHNAAAVGSGFNVTVKHATGATATNQFSLPAGADIVVTPQSTQRIWYDGTSTRWKV